jgi:hypothetical protein
VSQSWEYQNELQRPVLFGTRRVGPDLSREGGRRSNDWQAVHLFKPTLLSDGSVMPEYPWFFEGSPDKPNLRGLGLLTYLQWLGSWLPTYPYYEEWTSAHLPEGVEPGAVDQGAIDAANQGVAGEGAAEPPTQPESEPASPEKDGDAEPSNETKSGEENGSDEATETPPAQASPASKDEPKPSEPEPTPGTNPEPSTTEPGAGEAPAESAGEGDRPPAPDDPMVWQRASARFATVEVA